MKKILGIISSLLVMSMVFSQNNLDLLGLNGGSTAGLAFSVRKLSSSYSSPIMQLRRASDQAEGMLYFDGNDITGNSDVVLVSGIAVASTLGSVGTGNISTVQAKTGTISIETTLSGRISTNVGTTTVTGAATNFTTDLAPGDVLFSTGNLMIGIVKTINSNNNLTLRNGAMMTNNAVQFKLRKAKVTGVGTAFTTELHVGDKLYTTSNVLLGTVVQIVNDNTLYLDGLTASTASGVSFVSTGTTVSGAGTDFTQLQVGKMLISNGTTVGIIASIESATALTLTTKAGIAVSGQAFKHTNGSMSYSAFYAGTSVYVRSWYDQSGYGRNITQYKASSSLPRVVNAGVPDTKNGRQTVLFDRTAQMYLWTNEPADFLANTLYTVNNVTSETIMPGSQYSFVMSTTGHTGPTNTVHHYGYRSYSVFTVAQYSNDQNFTVTPSINLEVHTAVKTMVDRSKLIIDNNLIGTIVSGSGSHLRDLGYYSIGYYGPTSTYFHGTVSEAIVYASALGDMERQAMDQNQMAYYLISTANWTGAIDTDWFKTGNWANGVVPNLTNNITAVIPAGLTNYPNITGTTAEVMNMNIASGASCTISGTLKLGGTITNNGTCHASTGTLEMVAASPQLLVPGTFSSSTVGSLIINTTNNAQVSLAGNLTISNSLTFASNGKFSLSGSVLTLQGNVVNTVAGRLIAGTNATIEVTGSASPTLSFDIVTTNGNALKKLGINTTGVVTLASDLIIANTSNAAGLAFTKGKLSIGSNTLTLRNASTIVNTVAGGLVGSSNSNIVLEGNVNRQLSFDQTQPGVSNLLKNLSIATTGTNTTTVANDVVVNGLLNVNAGEVLDMSTAALTGTPTGITLNGLLKTQSMSSTPLPANATWNGTGTVEYNAAVSTSPQTAVGGTFYNLSVSNSIGGAKAGGNIVINNVLSLSANPAANRGSLEMTIDYADYASVSSRTSPDSTGLATPLNNYYNKLNSYILDLKPNATTTGVGDVTGKVRRSGILAGVEYSFGNPNNSITFSSNGTLPSSITFITKIGAAYHLIDTSVNRHYQIIRAGGTTSNTFTVKLRYLESEVHGNDVGNENKLVLWDHHIPYGGATPHMHGKTAQSLTDRWIALSGHSVTYLCDSTAFEAGSFAKYWSINQANTSNNFTWIGAVPGASNWNVASNWNGGVVPGPDDDVIIPDAAISSYDPNLPNDISIRSLVIENGGVMNSNNKTITITGGPTTGGNTISGSWINNGTFNAGTGTVIFTNANATIAGINQFHHITVAAGATLTPESGSTILISGTFTNNGTLQADFNPATIEYNGTGSQTLLTPNGGGGAYYHLCLDNANMILPEQIKVLGNINNNAATSFANTTVLFDGIVQQLVAGSVAPNFNHVTINNEAGVQLQADATVHGTLTLNAGVLNIGIQSLTLMDNVMFSGTGAFYSDVAGTIIYGKTVDGQHILPGQYGNLTFSNYAKQLPAAEIKIAGAFAPGNSFTHVTTGNTIVFNGAAQTIPSFHFNSMVCNGTGDKTVADSAFVQDSLDIQQGVILNSNNVLVLQSSVSATARVSRLDNDGGGSINGQVIVERYLPAYAPAVGYGRRWRFLSIPVLNDNLTIRDAWANSRTATSIYPDGDAGLGTVISGHGYADAFTANAAGFDWFSGLDANSLSGIRYYSHNGTAGSWSSSTNTPNVLELQSAGNQQQGYLLYVRGDRSSGSDAAGNGETLLRPIGMLKTGQQSITIATKANKGYVAVGNPYASPIDVETIQTDNASVITNRMWVWDAKLGDRQGGFRLATKVGTQWKTTPYRFGAESQSYSDDIRYIQSGSAFVVEPTAAGGTLFINEAHKVNAGTALVRLDPPPPDGSGTPLFMTNLLGNISGTYSLLDGTMSLYDVGYNTNMTDAYDIIKLENVNEQLSIASGGSLLAWEARPDVEYWDTIYLNLAQLQQRDYALELFAENLNTSGLSARLLDAFLSTDTPLDLAGGVVTYPFSVTTAAGSYASNRFKIVFRGPLILPLPSITAKAYKQQAVNIVTWNTADEGNLKGFEVERSANGQVFQKMATVLANGNSVGEAYTWTDAIPLNGNNYYRIKVLAQNGKVQYSQVMLVGPAAATATVAVYPQPALNGQFNLHLSGFSDGKYELRLINTFGQPVWTQMLQHKGSVAVYSVTVGQQYLATGLYQLQVLKNGKPVCIKPVLLQ